MKVSDLQQNSVLTSHIQKETSGKRNEKLWQASKDMESVFMTMLLKALEKTVPEGGLLDSKNSLSKMMFSSVMGKEIADNGGIGLAKHIYESMKDNDTDSLPGIETDNLPDLLYNIKYPEDTNE